MKPRWINPYQERAASHPQILINSMLPPEETHVATITRLINSFQHCFCELGSGSGEHILALATKNPQSIFFGIELRFKRAVRTAEKAAQLGLKNLYILRTDAKHLSAIFSEHSLDGLYMNFPDPWEKKRWLKNRMMSQDFLDKAQILLKKEGFISFKTDHPGYFKDTIQLIEQTQSYILESKSEDLYQTQIASEIIPTEFERLFRSKKQPIFFIRLKKFTN
jgi:tRNA (guanine-N7-)-methyltransferase